jgi:hypothetical protein
MLPPWQKYPDIALGSIGWRMGYGEEYWSEFREWFLRKHLEAKLRFAEENPEPPSWKGFYARLGVIDPETP